MNPEMTALEREVMDLILDGHGEFLSTLRHQLKSVQVANREYTGCGFFTTFNVPPGLPRIPVKARFTVGDVAADIVGLKYGAGFVLFIENGSLDMLEGFSYDEPWPLVVEGFQLSYTSQRSRHIEDLLKSWEEAE